MKIGKKERLELSYIDRVKEAFFYGRKTRAVWEMWHSIVGNPGSLSFEEALKRCRVQKGTLVHEGLVELKKEFDASQ